MSDPLTWVILSDKRGDNGQVETIADALPWPCERKHVAMLEQYVYGKPRFAPSLHHLDLARSDALAAPWPDLILTIGRRPSMVALWIRQQSGNKTRVVLVGKPTGHMMDFDLIICSAEKHLPPMPNFVPITLPLMRVDPESVAAEACQWETRWAALPRPLIALFVGGTTSPFVMNQQVAQDLLRTARWVIEELGGTPYISTSRRTAPAVVDALRSGLPAGAHLFEWQEHVRENPYRALLGSADACIVTGDSISMMIEVIYLRRPLAIFALPYSTFGRLDQLRRSLAHWLFNPALQTGADRLRHRLARLVYHLDVFTVLSSTRDFTAFQKLLVERKLAVWSGQPFQESVTELPDDVPMAVARIEALFSS